jgi:hypothetical protein
MLIAFFKCGPPHIPVNAAMPNKSFAAKDIP